MGFRKGIMVLPLLLMAFDSALAGRCEGAFLNAPAAIEETLSQKIRSNPQGFPSALIKYLDKDNRLRSYLKFKGWISGDSHPGQWTFIPNEQGFIYTLADFDMAGRGPLFFDFLQYALNVKAVIHQSSSSKSNIRIKEMLNAYLAGLEKKELDPPNWIENLTDIKKKPFLKIEKKYYDKKFTNNQLDLEEGFENISDPFIVESLSKSLKENPLFNRYKILDFSRKIIERGGSAGQDRFWVLTEENITGRRIIFEIKEKQAGFLESWENSTEKMYQFYWYKLQHEAYTSILFNGRAFEVRPKKIALEEGDIPYNLSSKKEWNFFEEKVLFDLYLIGRAHALQLPDSQFFSLLTSGYDEVVGSSKQFIQEYIKKQKEE